MVKIIGSVDFPGSNGTFGKSNLKTEHEHESGMYGQINQLSYLISYIKFSTVSIKSPVIKPIPKDGWTRCVYATLDVSGMSEIWQHQTFPNLKWLYCTIKQRLTDQFVQKWQML